MAQLRPRDAAGDGLPLSTGRGRGNPPSSWGPSGPAKNRSLGHPRALSGQPLTGRRPQETPRPPALPRSRGRALSGPARPSGPSELSRRGGPAPEGAPPRRPSARGLPARRGKQRAASGPRGRAPRPAQPSRPPWDTAAGTTLPPCGPRGPRDRRQARRGLLTLTLRSRERRPGRRGGTGTTARAARSEAPPPPQLLRCRRAARQETGSFGAGRPPARPGVWAGGARRPAP